MQMVSVKSSNITKIGWEANFNPNNDPEFIPRDTLRVEFSYGAIYDLWKVPQELFHEFLKAESKGSFYNKYLRDKYIAIRRN